MQIKRSVIGLALAAAAAGGLVAGTTATSPNIYYDLSPATNNGPVVTTPDTATATATATAGNSPATATPPIYYDL
ncbi:hypothetical protein HC031_20165 [Planosporangium thailandense]|uniref:Uncharacterized protein n=1 Tax=Planosporangium thailandense TaxID=765197 RepID=A0ABX0Y110_9ACTN|nr:hypothetical protein [Planosporangium thailandense]NJC72013.1 hypothetical protein [Planosporangium thailandense]